VAAPLFAFFLKYLHVRLVGGRHYLGNFDHKRFYLFGQTTAIIHSFPNRIPPALASPLKLDTPCAKLRRVRNVYGQLGFRGWEIWVLRIPA